MLKEAYLAIVSQRKPLHKGLGAFLRERIVHSKAVTIALALVLMPLYNCNCSAIGAAAMKSEEGVFDMKYTMIAANANFWRVTIR